VQSFTKEHSSKTITRSRVTLTAPSSKSLALVIAVALSLDEAARPATTCLDFEAR